MQVGKGLNETFSGESYGVIFTLQGWTLQNIPIISENDLNESCSELNFLQRT